MRRISLIALSLFLCACDGARQKAVGLSDWRDVMVVTEAMIYRGDVALLLRHSDTRGISNKKAEELASALRSWRGVPKTLKLDRVEILDFEDFKPREGVPPEISQGLRQQRWSRAPEKIIVYRYTGPDDVTVRWTFGVFREQGSWYFAVGYLE